MGSNANIYLPAHVKNKDVFEVANKIFGASYIQTTSDKQFYTRENGKMKIFQQPVAFDSDRPSCSENPWYNVLSKEYEEKTQIQNNTITTDSLTHVRFCFVDLNNESFSCSYYFETEHDELEPNNKLLYPTTGAVWCAVGKKLVDFFGGKMQYDDQGLEDWYICANPKYPAKKENQTSNERWYQYHNALHNEPMLTSDEILEAGEKVKAYDRDKNLIETLKKFELLQRLDKTLDASDKVTPKKKI